MRGRRFRWVSVAVVGLVILGPASAALAAVSQSPQVIRFHGGGNDRANAFTMDATGNLYLAGSTEAPNTDITFSAVKLDSAGALIWRRTYSGSRGGTLGLASAVAVDGAGNVYVAGSVGGTGAVDLLVVKLNRDGVEQWAQRYDNGGFDQATEIAVDQSGAVYVGGNSMGAGSGFDWVTQRYTAAGTLQWTRRHSGPGAADDTVSDLAVAPNGTVVVAGNSKNTGDGVTNDIDVLTYDAQGATVWQRRFTDTAISDELAGDLDIDPTGRIAVTGSTAQNASPEFGIPTPLTLVYDASGTLSRTVRVGGAAIDVDATGNAYTAGFFSTPNASAVGKFDATGGQVWLTPLTFAANETPFITAIAVDTTGQVTVAGTLTNNLNLNADYITIRYAADGRELWRHRFNGTGDGADRVAGLVIDGQNAALVGGTSFNNPVFSGGTGDDMTTLRFPAGVTPGEGGPPAAPSQLTAASQSRSEIRLTWRDNAANETGSRIERCRGAGCTGFVEIAVVGANATTFVDSGLVRNTTYTYRIRAFNADGVSAFSNITAARTRR